MKRFLFAAAFAAFATSSIAAEVVLGRDGSENVFVWKDSDSHSEAIQLIIAGVHKTQPMLVLQLMSCMVPSGTKAIITDVGFASHTILITSGDNAGCRGEIAREDVRN